RNGCHARAGGIGGPDRQRTLNLRIPTKSNTIPPPAARRIRPLVRTLDSCPPARAASAGRTSARARDARRPGVPLRLGNDQRLQLEQPARAGAFALHLDVAADPIEQIDEAGVAAERPEDRVALEGAVIA